MCVYMLCSRSQVQFPVPRKREKEPKLCSRGVHNIEEAWSWRDGSTVRVLVALAEYLGKIRKKGLISRRASLNSLTE